MQNSQAESSVDSPQEIDFRVLFERGPGLMLVLSSDFRILTATDAYVRATLTKLDAIRGRNIFDVFTDDPNDPAATGVANLRASLERVALTRKPDAMAVQKYSVELPEAPGQFEERYWSPFNSPVLGSNGQLRYIVHRVEDVTAFIRERHAEARQRVLRAEEATELEIFSRAQQIQDANRDLRTHKHQLETRLRELELQAAREEVQRHKSAIDRFFALSLDLFCVAGTDGYMRRVNPAFTRLGYAEEELLGRPMIDFVHPEDRERTQTQLATLASGKHVAQFENRYCCKDGTYRWLSWSTAPDGAGALYAVGRDVTEQREVARAMQHAKEAAETANHELEAFSYSVAHDLRAPLRAIDGFSQALLEDYAERFDDDGRDHLARLRAAAQRMAQLIDDLLGLSRLSRHELVRTSVDLSAVSQTVVDRLRDSQKDRSVEVVIEPGMKVNGDARLLAAALDNLVGNAWKFSARKEAPRIEIGSKLEDGRNVFFVRDNGAGFDMKYVDKLFGPFQRLHGVREFEGTGIGLATVQRIIARHGGRIWSEAEVGRGATFFFTLPERNA